MIGPGQDLARSDLQADCEEHIQWTVTRPVTVASTVLHSFFQFLNTFGEVSFSSKIIALPSQVEESKKVNF